jgi:hypothetical protein
LPRKHRVPKVRRPDLSPSLREFFISGDDFAPLAAAAGTGSRWGVLLELPLHAHRQWAWRQHRASVLKDWPAGRRPWAWWQYDAPAPRQILAQGPVTNATILRRAHGIALSLESWEGRRLIGYAPADTRLVLEAQALYLQRHRLLTKAEEEMLQPKDFEPIVLGPWEIENGGGSA